MFSQLQMNLARIMVLFGFAISASSAGAADFNSCPPLKKLAKELLQLEFSGQRYPKFEGSCVSKLKSDGILVRHLSVEDPEYKMQEKPNLVTRADVEITSVSKANFPDRYLVNFVVKKGESRIQDSFTMESFSGEVRKAGGCAAIAEAPKHFWIFSGCEKK